MGEGGAAREGEEEGISREEIRRVLRNMTEGNAVGGDEVPNEAWKWRGEDANEMAREYATGCERDSDSRRDESRD